jgi:glutamine synthetase
MLKAGLDGIKKRIPPPAPSEEDLYHLEDERRLQLATLPGSLSEALQELQKDLVIQEALGSHVYEWFVRAKSLEWEEYRCQVTPLELRDLLIY